MVFIVVVVTDVEVLVLVLVVLMLVVLVTVFVEMETLVGRARVMPGKLVEVVLVTVEVTVGAVPPINVVDVTVVRCVRVRVVVFGMVSSFVLVRKQADHHVNVR